MRLASRIPLCPGCWRAREPFAAEFFYTSCGTPFENAFLLDFPLRRALCRHGLRGLAAYCCGAYEGLLREWVHLYKYGCVKTLAGPLVELLSAALRRHEHLDCAAPVPFDRRRRWERGFNQAELLACGIGRKWHFPVVRALRRVRPTPTHTSLSNAARQRNVPAAFACRRSVAGYRVLLVDDVRTTGAACAAALRRSRAGRVVLLTADRADRRLAVPITSDVDSEETSNHG